MTEVFGLIKFLRREYLRSICSIYRSEKEVSVRSCGTSSQTDSLCNFNFAVCFNDSLYFFCEIVATNVTNLIW